MYIVHTWTSPNSLFRRFIYSRALSEGLHARLRAVIGQDVVGLAPFFGNTTEYDSFWVDPSIWKYWIWHWNSTRKIAKRVLSQLKRGVYHVFHSSGKLSFIAGRVPWEKWKLVFPNLNTKCWKWQKDKKKATVIMEYIENHVHLIPKTTKQGSVCGIPWFERKGWLLLATLPKTLGGCYAKLPKTESLYALRSSEICTVSNVVTVDLHWG